MQIRMENGENGEIKNMLRREEMKWERVVGTW